MQHNLAKRKYQSRCKLIHFGRLFTWACYGECVSKSVSRKRCYFLKTHTCAKQQQRRRIRRTTDRIINDDKFSMLQNGLSLLFFGDAKLLFFQSLSFYFCSCCFAFFGESLLFIEPLLTFALLRSPSQQRRRAPAPPANDAPLSLFSLLRFPARLCVVSHTRFGCHLFCCSNVITKSTSQLCFATTDRFFSGTANLFQVVNSQQI